eukprot:COSAG04_NODE_7885_length_1051_cov_16.018908_2_plen_52_part_01
MGVAARRMVSALRVALRVLSSNRSVGVSTKALLLGLNTKVCIAHAQLGAHTH